MGIKWWGYVHVDGSLHAKRCGCYDGELEELRYAILSDFVKSIHGPWSEHKVTTKEEAVKKIEAEVKDRERHEEIMDRLWGYRK